MYFVWGLIGAILGFVVGGDERTAGTVFGLAIGIGWARMSALRRDLDIARRELVELTRAPPAVPPVVAAAPPITAPEAAPVTTPVAAPVTTPVAAPVAPSPPPPVRPAPVVAAAAPANAPPSPTPQPQAPPTPTFIDHLAARIRAWFTEGNVPVKIGILVLFAGVAALLKYAADVGMLNVPIPVRIALVALAAIVALAFGWKQRDTRRAFGLSMQGGAIGVLVITVFAAFRLYHLLPPTAAFGLLVVLVAGAGILAVLQDALALAVLGILAGFAAPILTSTGSGSHVALFTYYAVLNLAILAIAWKRAWRVLNVLGFVATFGVGAAWGVLSYRPENFASTEPFLVLNFLFYLIIPWLYLRRAARTSERVLDGSLLFGNPLISLLLQGALLRWHGPAMAISALVAAVVYLAVAYSVRKHRDLGLLRDAWAVLAIAFATLAVPLALSASVTASVFALEGAGLVWLGWREQRALARWSGLGLQLLAAASLGFGVWHTSMHAVPVLNREYISAILIVVGGAACCWLYNRYGKVAQGADAIAVALFAWASLWWLGATGAEILRFLDHRPAAAGLIMLLAVSAWAMAELLRRTSRGALTIAMGLGAAVLTWLSILPVLLLELVTWQPLAGWLLLAVAVMAIAGWRMLACLRDYPLIASVTQLGWWWRWLAVAVVAILVALDGTRWLGDAWVLALICTPALALWFAAMRYPRAMLTPLANTPVHTRIWLVHSLLVALGLVFLGALFAEGAASPLPFIPVLNPTDLLLLAILAGVAWWFHQTRQVLQIRPSVLGLAGMAFATSATLRGVHHLANVDWNDALGASSVAQMSLTVVWSVLGVVAWVWGSRRGQRLLWAAGAITMGVVLAKLLLVDRSHLGNLWGIASFIAYGLLCTVIGYFAPAPPRHAVLAEEGADAH
jgi:uncharacterized membrane protein